MKKKLFVVGTSLALSLSLGLAGCSTSSSSTTTVETEVTDEEGNTTTTTTETVSTTDEQGNTETTTNTSSTTTQSGDQITYTNKELGFEATLPVSYKQIDDPAAEGEETVLCAVDDNDNELLIDYRDMTTEPSYDDEYKWADDYSDEVLDELDKIGEKVSEANLTGDATLAGSPCTLFEVRSTDENGVEYFRDYFFFLVDTNDGPQGLRIQFFCKSEEELDNLENCFVSI